MSQDVEDLNGLNSAVCNPETLADLVDLFGRERLSRLLGGLDDEIVQRLATASPDPSSLRAHAHAMVSVSGTLGFSGLSSACIALEQACIDDGDIARALRIVQVEAERARPVIAELRTISP